MSDLTGVVSHHSIYGGIGIPYGSFAGKALAAPVFSGTIPDLAYDTDTGQYNTDTGAYFTGATSYSIAPAVPATWTFNTSTGLLTVDTDEDYFGNFVVTGTNASGSDDSNSFSVTISVAEVEEAEPEAFTGGWAFEYQNEVVRRAKKKKELEELEEKAEKIADDLERQLAIEIHQEEKDKERLAELKRLTKIAEKHEKAVTELGERVTKAYERAIIKQTFSAMEALERTIRQAKEEEDFLVRVTLELIH